MLAVVQALGQCGVLLYVQGGGVRQRRPIKAGGIGLLCAVGLAMVACGGDQPPSSIAPPPVEEPTSESASPATEPAEADPPSPSLPSEATDEAPTTPTPPSPALPGTAIDPPEAAQLIAASPEARINLRSQPSTEAAAQGYGLVGDAVDLLRQVSGTDGYGWYYVEFDQSGAKGWIREDFINTAGQAPLPAELAQAETCEGLLEVLSFTAYHRNGTFQQVRFTNLETKSSFDTALTVAPATPDGKPVYLGQVSPPAGGNIAVQLTDLSGGSPGGGSAVEVLYSDILAGTGTCP